MRANKLAVHFEQVMKKFDLQGKENGKFQVFQIGASTVAN